MGLLQGSITLTGRRFAGENYRDGFSGECVRGWSWCRVARRGGDAAGVGGSERAVGAGHCGVGGHLPGPWIYEPGAVFADLAAAVADGVNCIDGVGQACGDREHVFGPAASTTTCGDWSTNASMRFTCRVSEPRVPTHGRRRGLRGRRRSRVSGFTWMSMPP
jgi:hypothetical protein